MIWVIERACLGSAAMLLNGRGVLSPIDPGQGAGRDESQLELSTTSWMDLTRRWDVWLLLMV